MNIGTIVEHWLSDPTKVTASALMMLAILAFYKVLILPRQTHLEAIAQLVASHKEAIAKLESDLQREREENSRLQAMVNRNVDVVDKALNTLEKAQHAFEIAHQFRTAMFSNPDKGS